MQTPVSDAWYNRLGFFRTEWEWGPGAYWEWHGYGHAEWVPGWLVSSLAGLLLICAAALLIAGVGAPRALRPLARFASAIGVACCLFSVLSVDEITDVNFAWLVICPALLVAWFMDPARTRGRRVFRSALFALLVLFNPDSWLMLLDRLDADEPLHFYEMLLLVQYAGLLGVLWLTPRNPERLQSLARVLTPLLLLPFLLGYVLQWAFPSSSNDWIVLVVIAPLATLASAIWIAASLRSRRTSLDTKTPAIA